MANNNNNESKPIVIVLDSCKELGQLVIENLDNRFNFKYMKTQIFRFNNGEINTFPIESVRERSVFIIASGSKYDHDTVNDNIMAMMAMLRSCRDASAKHITLICAYLPYCRSDKQDQSRAPIMAKLICDLFKTAGANRIITFDLHAAQIQGFFDGPVDNLYATNSIIERIEKDFSTEKDKFIVVSPDVGGLKRIQDCSNQLGAEYTFLVKKRNHDKISQITNHELVYNIDMHDKIAIIIDDIGDTIGTLVSAAKILKEKGAKKVIVAITHGIFSGKAFENLKEDYLDLIYVSNTLPQKENLQKANSKIQVVDISDLCAEAIICCTTGVTMSQLFN